MTRHAASLPRAYFVGLYGDQTDPWGFETSPYEQAKYAATLASLPRARYRAAFEAGCSNGVLTRLLAERCDRLDAFDVVPRALDAARARCADQPWVAFREAGVPGDWPEGRFDLVVLSEMVYYLTPPDVAALAARVSECLEPGGDAVLVHYLGDTDYPLSGDAAAETFAAACPGLRPVHRVREASYRIDVLRADP